MLAELGHGGLLIVGRFERHEASVHQLRHAFRGVRQQELADADVVDQAALIVHDVDDVERLAVLTVRADVIEDLLDRPVLVDRDVVRRHQPADRAFGVAEQRDGDRALLRRQEREQFAGDGRGQFLEEHGAVVRRHVVQQRRHVFLRQGLEQRFAGLLRQILERGRRVAPRQQPEDDRLILEAQVREQVGEIARGAVAHHVAKLGEIAQADGGGEFVRRFRHLPDRPQRVVAVGTVELLSHGRQGCSDDVVVMHVGPERLDGLEPHHVNEIEVFRVEGRRVGAEVVDVGAAARVVDDETDVERTALRRALVGVPEQARLRFGGDRAGLADEDFGRLEPEHRRNDGVEHVVRGHDEEPHGARVSFRGREHVREEQPFGRGRDGVVERVRVGVDAEETRRHDDHFSIARRAQRRRDVRERVRVADRHEQAARPRLDLLERQLVRRPELKCIDLARFGARVRGSARYRQRPRDDRERQRRPDGRGVMAREHRRLRGGEQRDDQPRAREPLTPAEMDGEGQLERRGGAARPQPDQRRRMKRERPRGRDGVRAREPRDVSAAREDRHDGGAAHGVDRAGLRAELRMR